jgi:hypothetical protein
VPNHNTTDDLLEIQLNFNEFNDYGNVGPTEPLPYAPINVKPEGAGEGGAFEFQIRFFVKHPILHKFYCFKLYLNAPISWQVFLFKYPHQHSAILN